MSSLPRGLAASPIILALEASSNIAPFGSVLVSLVSPGHDPAPPVSLREVELIGHGHLSLEGDICPGGALSDENGLVREAPV